ncbi:MAG TPA: ethanolamine ammonia-lyase reactivating factor EutA [Pseudonocardiaceae bacterium]|jgi:ethanolamine utilization protein EutA|nr:ethanolamine ammonia-lyase reactivating factor EutA [Pseudonocardiaceae bacterium]
MSHDHDHDHGPEDEVVLATEQAELVSAGVDIGSATSHLMLSRLVLRRRGLNLSSGFEVVSREVTYRSPVRLTPYLDPVTIDSTALGEFIDAGYAEAGVTPEDIDTGAVIVTGEAARKENARAISELFAEHSGRFVCAVAGPLLEARLATNGSGAVALSFDRGVPVLNLDIGGGTTKISLVSDGRIERVMVVNVGARLLAWAGDGVLTRVEAAGRLAAQACGAPYRVGEPIADAERKVVAEWLADRLFDQLAGVPDERLHVAGEPFVPPDGCVVVASGGVGEYVYGLELAEYGDLGRLLGSAIRTRLDSRFTLVPSAQRLRSTVIGASQYTVQVSGNTIFLTDPGRLPLHNLPVAHVRVGGTVPDADAVAAEVRTALYRLDAAADAPALALACHTGLVLSYPALSALAAGLADGLAEVHPVTVAVLLEQDCAGLLGHLLRPLTAVPNLLCVDQVAVADLDYVDVGKPVELIEAVPVVAKSLIFSG